ncbi:helix-turn-helix domain-containing protein [Streptomyces sp. WAC 06725]|uniref:helix-turn-helix domain-containing protein n=1 Tax=Streptomyces sp. WAC 06725 TaxID=2203209 RepID=UPI000F73E61E|nr:helix-turn-helix domain-containing protein [Streptomyces sp. WAC 06725]
MTGRSPSSPVPQPVPEPVAAFAEQLRELRLRCFEPTEARLALQMKCGRSSVSAMLNGRRFPSWELTCAFVTACGEEPGDWLDRWRDAKRRLDALRRDPDGRAAPTRPAALPDVGGDALLAATWYRSNPEFYSAAARSVRSARSEIRVTYTRRYPPDQYTTKASADYFADILAWAREDTEDQRSVRRIIGIPETDGVPDKDVLAWARRHRDETGDILNYEASVLRWTAAADGLNMALIDDSVVFLAFSGGSRQKLNGFSVQDRTYMSYFAAYFEQLWTPLQPLGTYLDATAGQ